MKYILLTLYTGMVALLAVATFVGQGWGADYAALHIYHTWWFFLLWGLLTVLAGIYLIKRKLLRHLPLGLLHGSLIIILVGAAVTFINGEEGTLHLRQGERVSAFVAHDGDIVPMPVTLQLRRFEVVCYPGTSTPSDFVSHVSYSDADNAPREAVISMNHILKVRGYRFYQTSFDSDNRGTILTVNHDPWGTAITYFGYALLAVSMVLTLFSRRVQFRRLLASPLLRRGAFMLLLLTTFAPAMEARSIPTINQEKAAEVARVQVVYNGRIVPLNTVALDFMEKIYGERNYHGLSAEQVLYGWMARPEVWGHEKFIRIKNKELRQRLGISGDYAAMDDLFDAQGHYRLMPMQQEAQGQGAMAKSLRELDEKAGLILMVVGRELFTPLAPHAPHLSEARINAELLYNEIPFTGVLFMACLTVGLLLFIVMIATAAPGRRTFRHRCFQGGYALMAVAFVFALIGYGLRGYIGGRLPLSNGYETMLMLSLLIMALTLLMGRRLPLLLPLGFILSGFTLLVSHLGEMSPQITNLMPVLHSPLLSIHVTVLMIAYALLAFMALIGIYACILCLRHRPSGGSTTEVAQLTALSRLMLYPAVFLLAIGIFLGAVWANISWGRYWSWDPKETWALITFMLYAVSLHDKSFPVLRKDIYYHLYTIFCFLAVLMTYFGVNYFMSGMHSYA